MTEPLEGNITISRRILKHPVWDRRDYGWAWIYLLALANDAPRTLTLAGKRVEIKRGQLAWSLRSLEKQLNAGREWLASFLKFCVDYGMITVKSNHDGTIITILNYDAYNRPPIQFDKDALPPANNIVESSSPVADSTAGASVEPKPVPAESNSLSRVDTGVPQFTDFPTDQAVEDYCNNFTDLPRGITSIPELWWRGWLSLMAQRPKFPLNWRYALRQSFLGDLAAKHPKALGIMPGVKQPEKPDEWS